MTFLKKYGKTILFAIIGICFVVNIKSCANKYDVAIAQMVADKVMARHHAAVKRIRDKYEPKIAAATQDIAQKNGEIADLGDTVINKDKQLTAARKEIAKLKTCDDKLVATTVLLDQAQGFILYVNNEYQIKVGALNLSWGNKYRLKSDEFDALSAEHEKTIAELGSCVKRATMSLLRGKKRVFLGAGLGYNPITGQPAVSVGVFYGIIRLPIRLL
jgi:hypothetical protein